MAPIFFQISISSLIGDSCFQVSAGQLHLDLLPALQIQSPKPNSVFPSQTCFSSASGLCEWHLNPRNAVSLSPLLPPTLPLSCSHGVLTVLPLELFSHGSHCNSDDCLHWCRPLAYLAKSITTTC